MKYANYQEFKSDFAAINQQLETHRAKCKLIFLLMASSGVAVFILLATYLTPIAAKFHALLVFLANASDKEWGITPTLSSYIAVCIIFGALGLWLIIYPIFSYRGKDSAGGMISRDYSFQDYVYSKVLACFGNFEFATSGGVFFSDLRNATIIPKYHSYISEDYIQGIINDSTLKIAETSLVRVANNKRTLVFKGFIIVIDISETKVKLRRDFAGKTVLIADNQKNVSSIAGKYQDYQKFALENSQHEAAFEAYTTDVLEAALLLKPDFINGLTELQQLISNAREQKQHIDDRIAYAAHAMLDCIKWPSRSSDFEQAYEENSPKLDLTKNDPLSIDADAINQTVQAEFFNDKLIITIPYTKDLFETNSLFEPALNEEDGKLVFALMQTIDSITKNLNEHFSTSH